VAADIISVRANSKHAHEDIWNQQAQEAKEAVHQQRKQNKGEYLALVRNINITKIQRMAHG
jgi:hypothetical protein